jgi:CRP-like cAMP-binding protein
LSHPNTFIQNLSKDDAAALTAALTPRDLPQGEVIAEPGDPVTHAIFVHSGLISVIVPLATGEAIEAGVVGRHEVFGACGALGAKCHVNKAVVQMPASASTIKTVDLAKLAAQSGTLHQALVVHEQFLLAQAQQSAACNARHSIPQRLATWLLRVSDRSAETELMLTQEFLSQMIGVQRASVSIAAGDLRDQGLISYHRGRIVIEKRAELEQLACECYAAIRTQHDRTIGAVGMGNSRAS